MRYLLTGLLVLAAVAALVTAGKIGNGYSGPETGCGNPAWDTIRIGDNSVMSPPDMSLRGEVPEVVVTAERPAWLMPVVVVSANCMPEVVAYASWSPAAVAGVGPQASFVN